MADNHSFTLNANNFINRLVPVALDFPARRAFLFERRVGKTPIR